MRAHFADAPPSKRGTLDVVVVLAVAMVSGVFLWLAGRSDNGSLGFFAASLGAAGTYFLSALLLSRGEKFFDASTRTKDLLRGALIGLGLTALFLAGAVVVKFIPFLVGPVEDLLDNARQGPLLGVVFVTLLSGAVEEFFFRRILPDRLPGGQKTRVFLSLLLYVLVTAALGVPLLAIAAIFVGLSAHWEAERSDSLTSPIALHLVWSMGMLFLLPLVISSY